MNQKSNFSILALLLFISACIQQSVGVIEFPEGTVQHFVKAKEIQWKPCPPNLPSGCEMAILEGSPQSPDLFTVRFKNDGELIMPPHSHPKDERVTVLKGNVSVAFGADGTREKANRFGPGDYYVNARDAIHSVWIDSFSIIQITGIGPWEVDFVENSGN